MKADLWAALSSHGNRRWAVDERTERTSIGQDRPASIPLRCCARASVTAMGFFLRSQIAVVSPTADNQIHSESCHTFLCLMC
jgi:hypothetical protein